jgi:hypothetical protein
MFDSCLPFLQLTIQYEEDTSFHIKTYIYRVKTPRGNYIVHVEEYVNDLYVVKFYPVRFKRHPNKFNIVANDGVLPVVIGTCLRILFQLFQTNSNSSFGFIATPSVFEGFIEDKSNNQRFRIYKQVMQNFFGHETFAHFSDVNISAYLMVNKSQHAIHELVDEMQRKFRDMYPDIFNLAFAQL